MSKKSYVVTRARNIDGTGQPIAGGLSLAEAETYKKELEQLESDEMESEGYWYEVMPDYRDEA